MPSHTALELLLGRARLAPYVLAASGDLTRALDLYLWATRLSGALHGQISFVEIAVRNAMDVQLASWNDAAGLGRDWSADNHTAEPLYSLLRKTVKEARGRASREAAERDSGHPRSGTSVTHDDVVAQLMCGSSSFALCIGRNRRTVRNSCGKRDIVDELTRRGVKLSIGGSVHDPEDPVGRLLFVTLTLTTGSTGVH